MSEEILKAIAAAYAAGYTKGVAASEGGYVDDPERASADWIESGGAHGVLQPAGISSTQK